MSASLQIKIVTLLGFVVLSTAMVVLTDEAGTPSQRLIAVASQY